MNAPVRLLVGFPAGGPLDIAARTIAPPLARALGTAVVVETMIGDSGDVATAAVAAAEPDGLTLLLCGPVNTINFILFPGRAVDFARDIAPVALLARVPLIVVVGPAGAVRTIAHLLALARSVPGRLRVGFAGAGTPQHIAIERFQSAAGVLVTMVPFAGSAAALDALECGEVDAMFDPAPSSLSRIAAGALVPLATTGVARSAVLPEVPALGEVLPGYIAGSWFGIGAPRGTPAAVVDRLGAAVNAVLGEAAVGARFRDLGATLDPGTAADFAAFIAADRDDYRRIIAANVGEPSEAVTPS